jgi:hypothetical protein
MKIFSLLLAGTTCFSLLSCGWRCEDGMCGWGASYKIDTTDITLVEQNLVIVDSLLLDEYNSTKYDSLEFKGYAFEQNREDSIILLLFEREHRGPHYRTIAFDTISFISNGLSAELYHRIHIVKKTSGCIKGTGAEVNPNCWTVKQSLRIREPACIGQVTYH